MANVYICVSDVSENQNEITPNTNLYTKKDVEKFTFFF